MCSLINKQLLLTAYAYLFIMGQQKAQRGAQGLREGPCDMEQKVGNLFMKAVDFFQPSRYHQYDRELPLCGEEGDHWDLPQEKPFCRQSTPYPDGNTCGVDHDHVTLRDTEDILNGQYRKKFGARRKNGGTSFCRAVKGAIPLGPKYVVGLEDGEITGIHETKTVGGQNFLLCKEKETRKEGHKKMLREKFEKYVKAVPDVGVLTKVLMEAAKKTKVLHGAEKETGVPWEAAELAGLMILSPRQDEKAVNDCWEALQVEADFYAFPLEIQTTWKNDWDTASSSARKHLLLKLMRATEKARKQWAK